MDAVQVLTQGFTIVWHNRDKAPVMRHGLPNGLQATSYGAKQAIPNSNSIIKIVKQDCVEQRPNRTSTCDAERVQGCLATF